MYRTFRIPKRIVVPATYWEHQRELVKQTFSILKRIAPLETYPQSIRLAQAEQLSESSNGSKSLQRLALASSQIDMVLFQNPQTDRIAETAMGPLAAVGHNVFRHPPTDRMAYSLRQMRKNRTTSSAFRILHRIDAPATSAVDGHPLL